MSIIHDALKKVQTKIQDTPEPTPAPVPRPAPAPQSPREKPSSDRSLPGILIPISLLACALIVALVIILYRTPFQINFHSAGEAGWHPFQHPMFSDWTQVSQEAQQAAAHTPVQFSGPIQQNPGPQENGGSATLVKAEPEPVVEAVPEPAPEPEIAEAKIPKPAEPEPEELVVNGIMAMGDEHVALINDDIYEVGDTINEMTILNITIDQIEVQAADGVKKLRVTRR